jgi:lipoate-protein ligase A
MLVGMRWHFHPTPAADGARNMALDEALMRRAARTRDAVFRVYGWSSPALSLGRNQRARGIYDCDRALALGVSFVRRPTGGRALLHHREITYSATLPVGGAAQATAAYEFINDVLLDALHALGVRAERAAGGASIAPGPRPCFDVAAPREIAIAGRKLVGSAQWRHDGVLLQHGSILVRDDQALIARITRDAGAAVPAAATLADALGREPQVNEVADVIHASLASRVSVDVTPLPDDDQVETDCRDLRHTYVDDAWTWRR